MQAAKGIRYQNTFKCLTVALATLGLAYSAYPATAAEPAQPAPQSGVKQLFIPPGIRRVPAGNDFADNNSEYSNQRKVESENVAIFWAKEYGDDPSTNPDTTKRFNVNDMLKECERIYDFYVNKLKFVEKGRSVTDQYKLLCFVVGGPGGTATGGAQGKVGILWTPATRVNKTPYGVVAHEIGHSFQSFVSLDGGLGFRGRGGSIYEMTAQYMLWQFYPEWMTFENYHLVDFMKKTHYAFLHEENQYHSPYVLEYWSNKHGIEFMGKLWRQAQQGEDPVMTYKRMNSLNQEQFNDEIFDAARRFITWDMPRVEKVASRYANQHHSTLNAVEDGWYRIAESNCPQNYGYNGIKLKVPAAGTEVTLNFKGIAGAPGFRAINVDKAGWRYGFLAVKEDGSRVYGKTYSNAEGTAQFVVPEKTAFLWLVVSGAPTEHWTHLTDQRVDNDEQWPYQIKLAGTSLNDSEIQ